MSFSPCGCARRERRESVIMPRYATWNTGGTLLVTALRENSIGGLLWSEDFAPTKLMHVAGRISASQAQNGGFTTLPEKNLGCGLHLKVKRRSLIRLPPHSLDSKFINYYNYIFGY
jgi:hypothetical protein